jgi:hypothetical protein
MPRSLFERWKRCLIQSSVDQYEPMHHTYRRKTREGKETKNLKTGRMLFLSHSNNNTYADHGPLYTPIRTL